MAEDKWSQPDAPPPPLFTGEKEKALVKQINDEVIERVIGQQVLYYSVSVEHSEFHDVYGEAIKKTTLPPVRVYALVEFEGIKTETSDFGVDKRSTINVKFHKRRLGEDQNVFVREGDFVLYGDIYYEIVKLSQPRKLFGQVDQTFEISATCKRARKGLFDAS